MPTRHSSAVWKGGLNLVVSDDAGRTFGGGGGAGGGTSYHSDVHALWIDPDDPEWLVLGTDGGVYVSVDRGTTFSTTGGMEGPSTTQAATFLSRSRPTASPARAPFSSQERCLSSAAYSKRPVSRSPRSALRRSRCSVFLPLS